MLENSSAHVTLAGIWRKCLLVMLLAAVLLGAQVLVSNHREVERFASSLQQDAMHVLELQRELLQFEIRAVHADVLYLAKQHLLQDYLDGEQDLSDDLANEYLHFAESKQVYDQVRILDLEGQERIRVNYRQGESSIVPPEQLQAKASREYVHQGLALERGELFISSFDLNVEHGVIEQPLEPVIRFVTPVYDAKGQKQGLLILNYLGSQLLTQLRQIASGFRGSTMLINSAGEYLQAADSSREWGWLLGHESSFRHDFPDVWQSFQANPQPQINHEGDLFVFETLKSKLTTQRAPSADVEAPLAGNLGSTFLVARVPAKLITLYSKENLTKLSGLFLAGMALLGLITYYWARAGELRRLHERHLAESESRLRQLSSALLDAQEAERRSISRTLHDELGQEITAVRLDLAHLARIAASEKVASPLEKLTSQVDQLLERLHSIAASTRPSVLDDLGLKDALESYVDEYSRLRKVEVSLELNFDQDELPVRIGENAYRIIVEALSNIAKHAETEQAEVRVWTEANHLMIEVRDGGKGFETQQLQASQRLGVLGMRERAELLGGRFHLESSPGLGTHITVWLPLMPDHPLEVNS